LRFQEPGDRLPLIEWLWWWDVTKLRWESEGLPGGMDTEECQRYLGLDPHLAISADPRGPGTPAPAYHGAPIVTDEASYQAILHCLYQERSIEELLVKARALRERHERGDLSIRLALDGYFWYPRTLLGIEQHLYAFYDQPELLHRMNRDVTLFHKRTLEAVLTVLEPDMIGITEDMSYNNGPMLSAECFDEFVKPYYKQIVPLIKERGIPVLVDSDGQVESMVPWLQDAGIDGIYPLEHQAGVDIPRIRARHPRFLMMGGFDKLVMNQGEAAVRSEFERLLPVMKSGGYVISVDHQTPPSVSLEQYKVYMRLHSEYAMKGALT